MISADNPVAIKKGLKRSFLTPAHSAPSSAVFQGQNLPARKKLGKAC